jgi:hypothetical protein
MIRQHLLEPLVDILALQGEVARAIAGSILPIVRELLQRAIDGSGLS